MCYTARKEKQSKQILVSAEETVMAVHCIHLVIGIRLCLRGKKKKKKKQHFASGLHTVSQGNLLSVMNKYFSTATKSDK